MIEPIQFTVKTEVTNSEIRQTVSGHAMQAAKRIVKIQDEHIRESLISLGWTPPKEFNHKSSNPEKKTFKNGMTVKELKEAILNWPETDYDGDPCEVWIDNGKECANQAKGITPLNYRTNDEGAVWADILLEIN